MSTLPPLPPAPVLRPTVEEWSSPMKVIAAAAAAARGAGIAKIVPPKGWKPSDTEVQRLSSKVHYATRVQRVHALQDGQPFPDGREYTYAEYKREAHRKKYRDFPHLVSPRLPNPYTAAPKPDTAPTYLAHVLSDPAPAVPDATVASRISSAASTDSDDVRTPPHPASVCSFAEDAEGRYMDGHETPYAHMMRAVEQEYWRIVETGSPHVTVEYGNDQDTRVVGSGFPAYADAATRAHPSTCVPRFDDPKYYEECGWNLNNIAWQQDSVLRYIPDEINGVNVPWLYLGMLFTSFAWHNEDQYMYSINYMHSGEGKTWYGVPGDYAEAFEASVAATLEGDASGPREVFHHLTMIVPPSHLVADNVPVCHLFQEAGEFVITLPKAYHTGFSHGFNVAEACNFALMDWLPFGREAIERYRSPTSQRSACFSHDRLLCMLAKNYAAYTPAECGIIVEELRHLLKAEEHDRAALQAQGLRAQLRLQTMNDPRYDCVQCRHTCHTCAVVCRCKASLGQVACPRHADALCPCPVSGKLCVCWYSIDDMRKMLDAVVARVLSTLGRPGTDSDT